MSGAPQVIVFGASFTDLCFYTDEFPQPGQTVNGTFETGFGGKGNNQVLCMQKLNPGISHFISSVGDDSFGENITKNHIKYNSSHFFVKSKFPTGSAGIYINNKGQNEIIIAEGAMQDLTLANIKEDLDKYLMKAKYIVTQCEQGYQNTLDILKYAKTTNPNIKVFFNPAPFKSDYDYKAMMPYIDVLIPNEIEDEELNKHVGQFDDRIQRIVTLGAQGVKLPNGKIIPAIKVNAIDTTGAGDCWIGSFMARLCENGENFEDAALFANKVAAISVTRRGTSASYPTRNELNE